MFGSLPELGEWQTHKYMLKWTEGDVWVSEQPLITSERHFFYKYRIIHGGALKHWECGIDRICQPELLPTGTHGIEVEGPLASGRNVHIHDEWEAFAVHFQVYDPTYEPGDHLAVQTFASADGQEAA